MFGLGLGRLGLNGGGGKSLAAQIMAMSPKLWLEPSVSGGYQDSAGTTALYAPGGGLVDPPVGLALDKSQGSELGPELVTNGDFSNGTTGWTSNPNVSFAVVSGAAELTAVTGSSAFQMFQTITTVVGKTYRVTGLVKAGASNAVAKSARFQVSGGFPAYPVAVNGVWQTITFCFVATATSTFIICDIASDAAWGAIGDKAYFDNVSVREIPGNHASQATSTARPVLSARINRLVASQDLTSASWAKNGVVADSATVIRVTVAGGSKAALQELSLPATPVVLRIELRAGNSGQLAFGILGGAWLGSAVIVSGPGTLGAASGLCGIYDLSASVTTVVDLSATIPSAGTYTVYHYPGSWYADAPVDATCEVLSSQLELGSTATPYQRVTTASDYDASAAPLVHKFDGVDDVHNVTFPSSLGSACTVVTANRYAAPTILTAQTIGTSLAINATHCGKLVFDRALTAGETAVVMAWANKQGGL